MKPNVLDLIYPGTMEITVYGKRVAAESLRFLEWFRFDALLMKTLWAFADFRLVDGITSLRKALETAGLDASTIDADDALAVFVVLGKLNELRYIDPFLLTKSKKEDDDADEGNVLVEIISTLATRFSMTEIRDMTPEFALLLWQRIREEIAADRNAIFYGSELGYDKRFVDKKGKYKLHPRESPYTPLWVSQRARHTRERVRTEREGQMPKFVTDPNKVIDLRAKKRLGELNLFKQKKGDENGQNT